MSREREGEGRLPKGVSLLARPRGGRRFLAKIRHKGVEAHLGLYESAGLAGFAFNVASEALGRGSRPPNEAIPGDQPDAGEVRRDHGEGPTTAQARPAEGPGPREIPPDPDQLLALFEVTVVGFWRGQAAEGDAASGLDSAARRLAEARAPGLLEPALGPPGPVRGDGPAGRAAAGAGRSAAPTSPGRSSTTTATTTGGSPDGWSSPTPSPRPGGSATRSAISTPSTSPATRPHQPASPTGRPSSASTRPFRTDRVRDAYRGLSKAAHPDAGGSHAAFLRLQAAYDEAREYCRILGV